jgi:hypothetical protein
MNVSKTRRAVAMTIAGAIVFASSTPLWAAPVFANPAAAQAAAPTNLTDVRYNGRGARGGRGPALGAAIMLGVVGAGIATQGYGPGNYGGYYGAGDDRGYYGGPTYAPSYGYGPGYGYGQCATDDRYGNCN